MISITTKELEIENDLKRKIEYYDCTLQKDSFAYKIYKQGVVKERKAQTQI